MEKTAWQKYKESLGETRPWDILNPNVEHAEDEVSNSRLDICKACPELIQFSKQCRKCGCFMNLKTKLENASCPIGKW